MPADLSAALALHQAGRLAEARAAYEAVLAAAPDDAEALHLSGVVRHQLGDHAGAVGRIAAAVAARPNVARYHANLAEAYRALGELDRAEGCNRTALRLAPDYPEALSNLGLVLQAKGDADGALDAFRRAVELRPAFAAARNNLGKLLREQGRLDEAETEFRRVVDADPDYAPARTNLGQLLLDRGRPDEALPHAEAAVRLRPTEAVFHHNLGNVLRGLDRLTEARAAYLDALRLDPNLAAAQARLGLTLQQEGRLDEARHWLQLATETDPDVDAHWEHLAGLYEEGEDFAGAARAWQRLADKHPDGASYRGALAWALQEDGRLHEAREQYEIALRLDPSVAATRLNQAGLFEEFGDLAAAEASFREALRLQPAFALPHARLATLLRDRLPDADQAALEARLGDPDLGARPRARLLFALAHVRDARNDFAGAAAALTEANSLTRDTDRSGREYAPAEHEKFVTAMVERFDAEFFRRTAGLGDPSPQPVFVFGLPRSGTTLIEQILAGHPKVVAVGERRWARWNFEAIPEVLGRDEPAMDCVRQLDAAAIRTLAARHLDWINAGAGPDGERVVDKMPDNYLYLGFLAGLFPNARFVHCRRDVRDVAVSLWMTDFRSIRWANDPDHIAHRIRLYRRLMAHWEWVLPVPVYTVDYEAVVADLEGSVARLLAACGLEWDPACLAFHTARRPVRTASVTQVRRPVYSRSVGRWRHYEEALRPLFAALAEDPSQPP